MKKIFFYLLNRLGENMNLFLKLKIKKVEKKKNNKDSIF